MLTIIVRSVFQQGKKLYPQIYLDECLYELYEMKVIKRQMKIKNFPDYVFDDNMIVDIKDFDSSQLEINKLSFKSVFSLNYLILYIKSIPTKNTNRVSINRTGNDEDFLYLFLDDADRHIEKTMELNI